jgi:hypothetical protein
MASFKRPRLSFGGENSRPDVQPTPHLRGACKIGDRAAEEVWVTNLDSAGCNLRLVTIGVTKSEPVTLDLTGEAPITGRLRSIRPGSLGMVFDAPLDEAQLERLLATKVPANVIALRKSELR